MEGAVECVAGGDEAVFLEVAGESGERLDLSRQVDYGLGPGGGGGVGAGEGGACVGWWGGGGFGEEGGGC